MLALPDQRSVPLRAENKNVLTTNLLGAFCFNERQQFPTTALD
jgi:hypothetical protein